MVSVKSQTLPEKCIAYLPKVLNKTIIFKTETEALASNGYGQNGTTNKYWDVYSDRCSNKLYSSPNASSPNGKTLSFNQNVRIASISNGFALVYTENKKGGVNYPQISNDVKCHGWVPMENLLLWSKCPTNSYGITNKALIVRNLTNERNENFGKISQNPDISNKEHVSYVRANTEFHYVLKKVDLGKSKRFLIAKTDNLSDATSDRVIEGWVSENCFLFWNQRLCIEPNWNEDDVEYFMASGHGTMIFEDRELSKPIVNLYWGQENKEGEENTKYRLAADAMRYPVIDYFKDDNVYKIGYFTPYGLYFEGYTQVKDMNGYNYWQPVVFMSSKELIWLNTRLEPLAVAARDNSSTAESRANYVNAIVAFIHSITEQSEEEIMQMTNDEITRILSGFSIDISMEKSGYSLSQIKDSSLCSDDEYERIIRNVSTKIDVLCSLTKSSRYKYQYEQNGTRYYWIPLNMFP